MKNYVLFLFAFIIQTTVFSQSIPAYFEITKSDENIGILVNSVKEALYSKGFKVIGEYTPADNEKLGVVCYTHSDLEKIAMDFEDRGALAAALKIGFKQEGEKVKVSMINPMYLFYAYFVDGIEKHETELIQISNNAKAAMESIGNSFRPFGGELEKKKLQKYRYKVMMPYFTNKEILHEFDSFEAGLKTLQSNLTNSKGNTEMVYELIFPDRKIAVFGVGLKNRENGENKFLPIIGDDHLAALPYEMILQGNEVSILPGRYRIALHWPDLTMGTFMKIMSTPGDIKNTMKLLTE